MKHINANKISKVFFSLFLLFVLSKCGTNKEAREYSFNEAFTPYIGAYSTGKISRQSTIKVRLNQNVVDQEKVGIAQLDKAFSFKPEIEGKSIWIDERTIQFEPSEPLPTDQYFKASFKLGDYLPGLKEDLQVFDFAFETEKQNFDISFAGFENTDKRRLRTQALNGLLTTADYEFSDKVEAMLVAKQEKKTRPITWSHSADGRSHTFRVDSIRRKESASKVEVSWNGKSINLEREGAEEIRVPALGEFSLVDYKTYNNPDQYVTLNFSDPVKKSQNLKGLIWMPDTKLRFVVAGNEIRVYPTRRVTGEQVLNVEPGVKNILGHKLKSKLSYDLQFEELKPQLRIVGKGNILPKSGTKLPFAFEAVGLKAVDLTITRIYEKNVLQFLQVNDLEGQRELHRVGKVVHTGTVRIDGNKKKNLHQWNQHVIDLGSVINPEPGAIYRVKIDMSRKHSIYTCESEAEAPEESETESSDGDWSSELEVEEDSYWDYYEEDDYGSAWENRDNPCHNAYYTYNSRAVSRNVLASDLGILAKRGTNGEMSVVVNDLHTTQPIQGVELEIYDYQQQLLKRITTGGDGIATTELDEMPFVVVAKNNKQRGYLKLGDGFALSLSKFDISGSRFYKGVKGFIYGERGVWRPGDSIFTTFMLEDKLNSLPENHPVTFTLTNSLGQLVNKTTKSRHLNGVYTYQTKTASSAPTGTYNLNVDVGGASFSKGIKIETIVPNRLKIKIDFGKDFLSQEMEELKGSLGVKWLHGAVAKNLKAQVDVTLTASKTKFKRFSTYQFDDPVRAFDSERQTIFEGKLDADGNAEVPLEIDVEGEAAGILKANFVTKAFEPGGAFSTDQFSIPYYPYERFVGIRLPKGDKSRGMILTDTDHRVKLVTVDADGNPKGNSKVEVALYKMDWRWWWAQDASNATSYNEKFYQEEVAKGKVTMVNGQGSWKFNVKYPAWGRYMVRACDEGGHCTGQIVYIDWPGWAGRAQKDNPGGATMLTFSTDKKKYKVGETVEVTIPTGIKGRALVSIESGSKVLESHWVTATEGASAKFSFTATEAMTPNIYVHASLLQPHAQTENDLPMRMYGVVPLEVIDPMTELKPKIKMASVLEPMSKANVTVSEATGKPMTYTVAVVDEGLLDLTRFATPEPWKKFYAREALDVKTWDLYDKVIGAYGADLTKLLGIGGDDMMAPKEGSKQNRFKPVVKFMGPFHLEAGQSRKHSFMIPNYVGSVRTMVVAREESAYGSAEVATPVRKPLMVMGSLPRVLGPGEEVQLPVSVFAMEDHVKKVSVTLEASSIFEVNGGKTKNISFNRPGDEMVSFALKVKERIGKGTVKVTAKSGNETAIYHIDIKVRNPNPRVVNVEEKAIDNGQNWDHAFAYPGMVGTNKGVLEVSSIPPIDLNKRLRYLLKYPHGCVEQTTSSVFPQLFVSNLTTIPKSAQLEIDKNIRAGIARLETFQQPNGGLSYWPGSGGVNEWGTNYAGNFIIEAKNKGYRVSQKFLSKWIKFQRKTAKNWTGGKRSEQVTQGDRLYLLAMAGSPELGAMNRLREVPSLDNVAKWRLAAAYKLAGQPEMANRVSKDLAVNVAAYKELGWTYGSDQRDQAIILECISVIGNRVRGASLSKKIAKALSSSEWMSTQTTGYSLIAIAKYAGVDKGEDTKMDFRFRIDGGKWQDATSTKPIYQVELNAGKSLEGRVEVKNKSGKLIFARVMTEGIPVKGDQDKSQNDLRMTIKYLDMDGEPINPDGIEQGTDFMAEIKLTNPGTKGDLDELALTQIFPSGWEIHNARMTGESFSREIAIPEYQDVRDDRVLTYFDLGSPGNKYRYPWSYPSRKTDKSSKTFRILLNASYLGRFYLPTVYCEAMYDKSISARIPGQWVSVIIPAES